MLCAICDTDSLTCLSAVSENELFSMFCGHEVGDEYGRYSMTTADL